MTDDDWDGHAGELLSAAIDGELEPADEAWLEAHLAECDGCRTLHHELSGTASALRTLPSLPGRHAVEGFLGRHRTVVRSGVAFVSVVAALVAVTAVTTGVVRPPVVPDVAALAEAHEASLRDQPPAEGARVRAMRRPYVAPELVQVGGRNLELSRMFRAPELAVVVYRSADATVSVFEQPGRLDWDGLPGGEVERLDGRATWISAQDPGVLVTEVGHVVVTVVCDDREAARATLAALPEGRRDGTWHRVHDAGSRLVSVFRFDG